MDRRMIDDEQEEHNVGSLDTSMDRYLEYLQLWRKRIPQDGSSLFRAFSEALFSTQVHHYDVRLTCIVYMRLYAEDFSPLIKMPFDKYLTHLKDPTTPGGMLEVEALARCYRVTIVVYSGKDHDPVECRYGAKKILLSLIGYQFDRVITEERRRLLGIVQAYVYKFLYSEVFNQPKVVEEAKAKLRKSDTLYYGVKGAGMIKNSDRSEKKTSHDPIPVPYRTAKAFEPAIYRNVAYDVYMNDHFKKYLDRSSNKQHQHIPFMAHNRLVERFGVKMHLPVSYLNPPDCRRVIVTLSNSEELFAYYVGEDAETNMHNVFLVKFGSMTKTTEERMLDFPASLGRRPVTFAQLKQHTSLYRKLKPCLDASAQFFEERSSRRQRQQATDYPAHQQSGPILRPYPPLMSSGTGSVMYSPPLETYPTTPNWFSSSNSSHPAVPILIPMNNPEQIQLQHRLSINVTDHYECTAHPNHLYPTYSTTTTTTSTTNSSSHDAMSLNGSLGSGTSTTDGSPYPLLAPMPTVFFNPYPPALNNDQHSATPYLSPTMFFSSALSPRLVAETRQSTMINEPVPTKFLPGQSPIVMMSSPHPLVNTAPPPPPMSNFHPISLVPRLYVDPTACSSTMPNIYLSNGQPSGGTYPLICSTSPSPHLSSWIPTGPPIASAAPTMPYFLPASHPPTPHFPFQQLI